MVRGHRESVCLIKETSPALQLLLGVRLRRWREARRIPPKRIAADLGVSSSLIYLWEQGRRFPSAAHLQHIAAYIGVPVCQLLYAGADDCPRRGRCQSYT